MYLGTRGMGEGGEDSRHIHNGKNAQGYKYSNVKDIPRFCSQPQTRISFRGINHDVVLKGVLQCF